MHHTDDHDTYGRTPDDHDDHGAPTTHASLMDEAGRMVAVRARVQRVYGSNAATRAMAPVGIHQRAFWANAGAGGPHPTAPVATTHAPLPAVHPRPAPRGDVAVGLALTGREMDRSVTCLWGRLRAALRLRIGDGVMPG